MRKQIKTGYESGGAGPNGALPAMLSCFCGGISIVAMHLTTSHSGNIVLSLCRAFFSVLPLLPVVFMRRARPSVEDSAALLLLGSLVAGVSPWMLFMGLEKAGATVAGIVLSAGPLITSMLAFAAGQEAFSIKRCVGATIAGSAILSSVLTTNTLHLEGNHDFLLGTAFLISTTLIGGLYDICCRKLLTRVTPLAASAFSVLGGFVFILILSIATGNLAKVQTLPFGIVLLLAVSGSVGGPLKLHLWSSALKVAQVSRVAAFTPLVSITVVLFDSVVTRSLPHPGVMLSVILIILGTLPVFRS
ncbi:DMT family transporter [Neorhizobium galegae]|nr:DMT family transporter [Neorhizobium galegae]